MAEVIIAGAARTPMGGFQGIFSDTSAAALGGVAIKAAIEGAQARPDQVQEVLMGCVLPAGQGQAPARQAAFAAGLADDVPATTLNKMCGSGMKTAMVAYDQIALGHSDIVVAGGMESMTNAPYLLPNMRGGARIGHGQAADHRRDGGSIRVGSPSQGDRDPEAAAGHTPPPPPHPDQAQQRRRNLLQL